MKFITWLIEIIKSLFKKKEEIVPERTFNDDMKIDENDWVVENQVCDVENNCLKVVYREKYGSEITEFCMVIFRNDKTQQYKFIAPWLKNELIERSNISGMIVKEVLKSEMKNV
jgi:hypothetical protein